jgi:hypothetical protein
MLLLCQNKLLSRFTQFYRLLKVANLTGGIIRMIEVSSFKTYGKKRGIDRLSFTIGEVKLWLPRPNGAVNPPL